MTDVATHEPEMLINRYGREVRANLVRPALRLEDQTVRALITKARAQRQALADFKRRAFDDVNTFMGLLADQYNVNKGGRRGGVTLESFDGLMRVEISIANMMAFGPELTIAKELIDQCLQKWSSGANTNLMAVVNEAFRVGDSGRVRVDRIIGLRRLEIVDQDWDNAMLAIGNALRVETSKSYIRFYERENAEAKWEQIGLDIARLA